MRWNHTTMMITLCVAALLLAGGCQEKQSSTACQDDDDCPATQECNPAGECVPICVPDCTGRCCGDDGCGGVCADHCAGTGQTCDTDSCQCEGVCVPQTCADLGLECGPAQDGCGETLDCGDCGANEACSANGQCETTCVPDCVGKCCGSDGCGGSCTDQCGDTGQTCNTSSCLCEGICVAQTCTDLGRVCGPAQDGCGGTLDCGTCTGANEHCDAAGQCVCDAMDCNGVCCDAGQVCDGGSCCTPQTCTDLGVECGSHSDGCGGTQSCGTCAGGGICQQGGTCCVPTDCVALGMDCGSASDGCGSTLSCGSCSAGDTCSAAGICICQPTTCAALGTQCGQDDDGCGGILSCGSCPAPQNCTAGACVTPPNPGPSLSLDPFPSGGQFDLRWTFSWGFLCSSDSRYELQESTTAPDSGFVTIDTIWDTNCQITNWVASLSRADGTYYYRVRARKMGAWTAWSNVITVVVATVPTQLRLVNDLHDQVVGTADWPSWNTIFRVWIAPDQTSLFNCSDSCDLLTPGSCGAPGQYLTPDTGGTSYLEFDTSAYQGQQYCVFVQAGWWDYVCLGGSCCWEEQHTWVADCDGVSLRQKFNYFCVNNPQGLLTVNASQLMPLGNYSGDAYWCP